jgi:hypothetical protein
MIDAAEQLRRNREIAQAVYEALDRHRMYTLSEHVCGTAIALASICRAFSIPLHRAIYVACEAYEQDVGGDAHVQREQEQANDATSPLYAQPTDEVRVLKSAAQLASDATYKTIPGSELARMFGGAAAADDRLPEPARDELADRRTGSAVFEAFAELTAASEHLASAAAQSTTVKDLMVWTAANMPVDPFATQAMSTAGGVVGTIVGAWFDAGADGPTVKEWLSRTIDLFWAAYSKAKGQ